MKKAIHPVTGSIALVTIATFWLSTVFAELFGSVGTIVAVKSAIPWGFLLLVPAIAATGGTGLMLSKGARSGLIGTKLKRMPIVAANGLLVMIPAALFLASRAKAGQFDFAFYAMQAVELIGGAANFALLSLNMLDGLRMKGRLRKR